MLLKQIKKKKELKDAERDVSSSWKFEFVLIKSKVKQRTVEI